MHFGETHCGIYGGGDNRLGGFWVGILSLLNTGSVTSGYCCPAYARGSEFVKRSQEGTLSVAAVGTERFIRKTL